MPSDLELSTGLIINHFSPDFRALYGTEFPRTYLAIDSETSGFSRDRDVILEFGHVLVVDGEITDRGSLVLDWCKSDALPIAYLRERLEYLRVEFLRQDREWRLTEGVLRAEGIHPVKGLEFIYELLSTAFANDIPVVGHNLYCFDCEMLVAAFAADLQREFEFPAGRVLDTGAIVKSSMMPSKTKVLPFQGESLAAWSRRVVKCHAPGIRWNLTNCAKFYGLDKTHNLSETDFHGAGFDAYVLHLLMERFRGLLKPQISSLIVPHAVIPGPARRQRNH